MRIALFECPSWSVAIPKEKQDKGRCYIVQGSVKLTNGAGVQPFGYPGDNGEQPHQIHEIEAPSRTWAITDLDEVNGAPNYTNSADPGIAIRPVHGSVRNALYFDGHVGIIPSS
jgi:prepilin-type processing-associated H-X9-DG protein